jgi:uncharacterized OB-fold protein
MTYTKPLPEPDQWSQPFWDACREHRLIAQRCNVSGKIWYPPAPVSPVTRDANWSWTELSGRGVVTSFVVMHQKYFAGFADELPYPVIEVTLAEGPVLISNIVELGTGNLAVGMAVQVVFKHATEQVTIPVFKPIEAGR